MLMFSICLLFLTNIVQVLGYAKTVSVAEQNINFLLDFIKFQQCPQKLIALSCISKGRKVCLTKIITNSSMTLNFWESHNFNKNLNKPVTILIDMECKNTNEILKKLGDSLYLQSAFHWILLVSNKTHLTFNPDIFFSINSNIFLATKYNNSFEIEAIYKYSKANKTFNANKVGLWNTTHNIFNFSRLLYVRNRSDLQGLQIRVLYFKPTKYVLDPSLRIISFQNLIRDMQWHSLLCQYLNATFAPVFFEGGLITVDGKSNTLNMLNLTKENRADILGTATPVIREQLKSFRYLVQTRGNRIGLIYRTPALASTNNIYTISFYRALWISSILIVASIIIWGVVNVHKLVYADSESDLTFLDIAFHIFSTTLQKNSNFELKSVSGRLAIAVFSLTILIEYVSYSTSLVVNLRATSETSIQDLYQSDMDIGIDCILEMLRDKKVNVSLYGQVHRSSVAVEGKLQKRNIENRTCFSLSEGMEKVRQGGFAFRTTLVAAYIKIATFEETDKCDLKIPPQHVRQISLYYATPRNSSFQNLFRIGFAKIIEYGLGNRQDIHFFPKPSCSTGFNNFAGIGIRQTRFVFLMLIFGIFLSVSILGLECLVFKYKNSLTFYRHYNGVIRIFGGVQVQPYTE